MCVGVADVINISSFDEVKAISVLRDRQRRAHRRFGLALACAIECLSSNEVQSDI